jgi:hypothetical protein
MRERTNGKYSRFLSRATTSRFLELARAAKVTPISLVAFVRLALVRYWRVALVITGLLVQAVLTVLMWQLVDLTVSLMEVWAELARKHLEIVLS